MEREKFIQDRSALLPELDGDRAWNQIICNPKARTALTAFLDQLEAEYKIAPAAFPEIKDEDFDLRS